MASNRIAWNQGVSTPTNAKLRSVISNGIAFRDALFELKQIVDKYNADASLAADIGVAAGTDQTAVNNLITQAYGELCNSVNLQLNVGSTSGVKQLIDSLG